MKSTNFQAQGHVPLIKLTSYLMLISLFLRKLKKNLTYKLGDRIKKHKLLDSDHNKHVASSTDKLARESFYSLIISSFLRVYDF
jgi:hypothetical protein